MMRSLNPCPENFAQNLVDYPNLLKGGRGGGVIYYTKSEVLDLEFLSQTYYFQGRRVVLDLESDLLFLGGGVIYYTKSEVLELESKLLFLAVGGKLLHAIGM